MHDFTNPKLFEEPALVEPISTATVAALGAGTTKAIEKSTASLVDRISLKFAKDKYDALRLVLDKGLPSYLEANYAKCETLKTLLNRNDPIALEDCFVAPDFKTIGGRISSDEFLGQVNQSGGKVVITGLAGSGKSVFLKYSFRSVIEKGHSYYPIFFELRSLNRLPKKKGMLLTEVFASVHECCESFTRAQFNHGLKSGAFYFLLDGFDELNQEIREQVSDEITAVARNHNKCALLVTSRPSDEFVSWEGFTEAKLLPFDLEKAVEYISKLRFDKDKKEDFLTDLKEGLFEENKDFLSNPLLSAMMLLTYDSFGEIPEKRHIFYAKCFDVLAREHDASKGRYKRDLFSDLAMDQIERAFMFFCAVSYVERTFSFNDEQMKKFVSEAIAACGIDADVSCVIRDFRESISIMEKVGLLFEFAHRSFQEYFYARFVVADRKLSLERKVGWLTDSFTSDDTVEMIADMDRTYFEDEFLLPNIKKLDRKLSPIDPQVNPVGILSKFYTRVHTSNRRRSNEDEDKPVISYTIKDGGNHFFLRQALWNYRDGTSYSFDPPAPKQEMDQEERIKILGEKYGDEIKIHHTNNAKLVEIEAHHYAQHIKDALTSLRQHLEEKEEKRKGGLGALIRHSYS